ncbi:MAG: 16S rRNA (guanine(527)-N(7))-methyltransferase RsmG [Firmicutes bacterium]|uniref:Ribosomal RNA small subunit methyltransferase G n=1 Tax=Candidatus Scybalomonas excrementavium TaxID=2840943 RepID=A0A9D9HZX2_9FIRM|nr:16S rRNA (guanine(527)-N(7))-methyltransferase RsmG [Candidatus Scybalomonas excrementavium]
MEQLKRKSEQLEVELTEQQLEQFKTYYEMLIEKNKVMNLTAITEKDEVIDKHFIDSISLNKAVDTTKPLKILDLGTGAGFPGIPLKIAYPNLTITLLDSLNKRIKFLQEVIDELGLQEIEGIHGRAEDFAKQPAYREQYDLCVSRAVANLATLSEYCLPYVKEGGCFISYKSGAVEEEVNQSKKAIAELGGRIKEVIAFTLPKTDIERTFVVIEKVKKTPKKYPRKAGLPSKEPLGL